MQAPDSLSVDQEKGIVALLSEPTIAKAAQSIGVGDTTMRRWLREPAFGRAYSTARRETFRHAIGLCNRYAPAAVQTLVKVMADPNSADSAKVAASGLLLKFSRESIELDDVVQRIEMLEQASQKQDATPGRGA